MENNLCFNCGRSGYRPRQCRNQGCLKCKYKHHISICDKEERENSKPNETLLTGHTTYAHRGEDTTPITPASIEGEVLWVYLDSGSALYFISSDAVKKLKLVTSRVARDIESERGQSPVHAHLWYQHRLSGLQSDWRNWTHWLSITWFHHCEEARHEPGEKQVLTHARGILKEVLNDDHRRVFDKPYPWSQYL